MDAYDMTKCAVVIMMTWTEEVLKRTSFMLTYTAWITTEFCAMPLVGSQRSESGQAKKGIVPD
jgi:hypothetical protein